MAPCCQHPDTGPALMSLPIGLMLLFWAELSGNMVGVVCFAIWGSSQWDQSFDRLSATLWPLSREDVTTASAQSTRDARTSVFASPPHCVSVYPCLGKAFWYSFRFTSWPVSGVLRVLTTALYYPRLGNIYILGELNHAACLQIHLLDLPNNSYVLAPRTDLDNGM